MMQGRRAHYGGRIVATLTDGNSGYINKRKRTHPIGGNGDERNERYEERDLCTTISTDCDWKNRT